MQRFFSTMTQKLSKNLLSLCLVSLMLLSGLFLLVQPPSYAATAQQMSNSAQMKTSPADREKAYDEAVQEAKDIESIEDTYEENLKEFKEENPQPNLLEKAEEVIENARGEK
jgi:hypothetical protein